MPKNYPAMNTRMRIVDMPTAAKDVFQKYRQLLIEVQEFDLERFIAELKASCGCTCQKSTTEMISVLWHATRDSTLVHYLDRLCTKPIEFEFYVARTYGAKGYRVAGMAECREKYWSKFRKETAYEANGIGDED